MVDVRPVEQRHRVGDLPGAIVVDRNILEWRLDPSFVLHLPEVTPASASRRCVQRGYASSLASAALQELGLRNTTDLIGGYQAWRAIVAPPAQ